MTPNRPVLPKEYRLSDLRSELNVSSVPDDPRSIHTLFAILFNDIDRRADVHQSIKPEILEGLAQAWLYFGQKENGVDVLIEQHRHGVDTTVEDPADDRPASSIGRRGTEQSIFNESLQAEPDFDVTLGQFERDMRRLDDLRRMYASPGLNTAESREAEELRDQYGLSHREWWQRDYLRDEDAEADSTTISRGTASATR